MTTIICVGKKTEPMYEQVTVHFESRLKFYTKISWQILPHSSLESYAARIGESKSILAKIQPLDYVILLDEIGEVLTSPQLAAHIEKSQNSSRNMVLVIGGAYGVDSSVRSRADVCLAFGKAVFPHQLMRIMLLEQMYRAYSILAGSKYHHT